jgi:glucosamine-6-phosphate deaminase
MSANTTAGIGVRSYATPADLGNAAGRQAAEVIIDRLATHDHVRLMLAAAPSQEATLASLVSSTAIDWSRVECFHMDEYVGLAPAAPQRFANWLQRVMFDIVMVGTFHRIDPGSSPVDEAKRYGRLMGEESFDLVLCGLGVNGHVAFNDPPADLVDAIPARLITLDETSRQQQVDEGHFEGLGDVPRQAITVTIPRLLNSACIIASVPGSAKRTAVAQTLREPVGGQHPGTSLRTHPNAFLYVDQESDPR